MVTRDGSEGALIQLSAAIRAAKTGEETPLAFAFAEADRKDPRYANGAELIGVRQGWETSSRAKKRVFLVRLKSDLLHPFHQSGLRSSIPASMPMPRQSGSGIAGGKVRR